MRSSQPSGVIMERRRWSSACSGTRGLQEDYGLLRIEAGGEVVDGDLQRIFGDGGSIGVVGGEGVPVGDEIETVVIGIGLEIDPVLESPEEVADVKATGGAHAGEYAFCGGGVATSVIEPQLIGMMERIRKDSRYRRSDIRGGKVGSQDAGVEIPVFFCVSKGEPET